MANALEQSATRAAEQVKTGHSDLAAQEVTNTLMNIERSKADPHQKAVQEAEYFNDMIKQNAELKKMGFPDIQLIETGERIDVKVGGNDSNMTWTSFSKEHPSKGGHTITQADAQAVDPELVTSSNGQFKMGAKRDDVQTGTGTDDTQPKRPFNLGDERDAVMHPEFHYPAPKKVDKPAVWDGAGTVQFNGKNVPVDFHNISDTNRPNLPYVGLIRQGDGHLQEVSGLLYKNGDSGNIVINKCVVDGQIQDAPPGWIIPMQKHDK
jgi:hypothetical protein